MAWFILGIGAGSCCPAGDLVSVETACVAGGELAGLWPFESSVDEVTWLVFVNRGTFVIVFGEPIFPFRRAAARASYYLSKAADGY